jgi:hypothetical protein
MTADEKIRFMNDVVKPIKKMLKARIKARKDAMTAYESNILDQLPDEVKVIREKEAVVIRAVMTEQQDLLDVLDLMYPEA